MVGAALMFMKNSKFDCSMGFARNDKKMEIMNARFGAKAHGIVYRFGLSCSVVIFEKEQVTLPLIARTQQQIEALWRDRTNHLPELELK
jgi:hypothetical protein